MMIPTVEWWMESVLYYRTLEKARWWISTQIPAPQIIGGANQSGYRREYGQMETRISRPGKTSRGGKITMETRYKLRDVRPKRGKRYEM